MMMMMASMDTFQRTLESFALLHQQLGGFLDVWLLTFSRTLPFVMQAALFSRKDMPSPLKVSIAMAMTTALINLPAVSSQASLLKEVTLPQFLLFVVLNAFLGAIIGFTTKWLIEIITSSGALTNNQIGLSAANIMDPTTQQQNALMGPFLGFIATLIYLSVGGLQWLIVGLAKTFTLIPLCGVVSNWFLHLTLAEIVHFSKQILDTGLILAAPFFVITIVLDIMLGIVNKTAQQIPVFQLGSSIKPLLGLMIFYLMLPSLLPVIRQILMTMGVHWH
jgi:flagellar biosynthetic protein FliR